eukprot:12985826-Ditylum_brightwellii.AAC.1
MKDAPQKVASIRQSMKQDTPTKLSKNIPAHQDGSTSKYLCLAYYKRLKGQLQWLQTDKSNQTHQGIHHMNNNYGQTTYYSCQGHPPNLV